MGAPAVWHRLWAVSSGGAMGGAWTGVVPVDALAVGVGGRQRDAVDGMGVFGGRPGAGHGRVVVIISG